MVLQQNFIQWKYFILVTLLTINFAYTHLTILALKQNSEEQERMNVEFIYLKNFHQKYFQLFLADLKILLLVVASISFFLFQFHRGCIFLGYTSRRETQPSFSHWCYSDWEGILSSERPNFSFIQRAGFLSFHS